MLIERKRLRQRFLGLVGPSHLATTTLAIDEAGSRLSSFLLVQLQVNSGFALVLGTSTTTTANSLLSSSSFLKVNLIYTFPGIFVTSASPGCVLGKKLGGAHPEYSLTFLPGITLTPRKQGTNRIFSALLVREIPYNRGDRTFRALRKFGTVKVENTSLRSDRMDSR